MIGVKMTSELHSNEMTPPTIFLQGSLSEVCKSVIVIFWDEVFMVRNTVKTG